MDSELYAAVINDNVDGFKEIEGRLSVGDQLTRTNNTVLHLACQYGSIKCVKQILLVYQSLLLKINPEAETALHLAARHGHYEVVVALIDAAKASVIQPNDLESNSFTVVQILIRAHNVEFETALHEAVRYNRKDVVQLLVKEDPSYSYPQNKHNETPLYMASIRCYVDIIKTIVDNCESPAFRGPDGRTALHAAVLNEDGLECAELLQQWNEDLIKVPDNHGWTVFHYVAYNGLHNVLEYLVGADKDKSVAYQPDKEYKRTALHVAAYRGNIRVMKKLLKYYPDSLEIVEGSGRNILHIALEQDQKAVISFILSFGPNNNLLIKRDNEGNSPLHMVANLGFYVPELMDRSEGDSEVDWEVLDQKNLSPIDILHCRQDTDPSANQAMVKGTLIRTNTERKNLWEKLKKQEAEKLIDVQISTDVETLRRETLREKRENEEKKASYERYYRNMNTHMIVAALIATVALTAGFAVPGGFDGNEGPSQGSAILLRKTAFEAFIVTDTIALLCSMTSLFMHFYVTLYAYHVKWLLKISVRLGLLSFVAIMLAFTTGTYAVLAHSPDLAITVCVMSSLFVLLPLFTAFGMYAIRYYVLGVDLVDYSFSQIH